LFTGPEVEERVLPKTVAVEPTTIEPLVVEPSEVEMTMAAPKLRSEVRVDPPQGSSTKIVIREAIIEEAVLLQSAPMRESGSLSREGLELRNDELIDPAVVALNWSHGTAWSSGST
jgi:hypothetical protein